jgi:hypothetical protein
VFLRAGVKKERWNGVEEDESVNKIWSVYHFSIR